ncbi:MAG: SusD/RagB family nutrient-binding outer membrane lipoprotein [Dinghuibacter sp.]|nr:SusD/RagB family nutrient-binding outer membrane lipoprotein [Dinghuibacter sp.]
MKKILSIQLMALVVLFATGCQKFSELEKDENRPVSVTPGLIFNGVVVGMHDGAWNLLHRWNQFACCNYNYYGNQEYNWTTASFSYTTLKNVVKMEEEALRSGLPAGNVYAALGKFFRAFYYYKMTMLTGDIPVKQALNPSVLTPEYDTQKDVFKQVLQWLDEANTALGQLIASGDNSLSGDIYFSNNLGQWRKVVNAFKLRVLVSLSKKEADTDLNIKQKFQAIMSDVSNNPLLTGNADNMQYQYNSQFNKYPVNPDNYGFDATRYNMSDTYLGKLVALKDPRVFFVAEPAGAKLKSGLLPTDHNAFAGASSAQDLADMSTRAGTDNGPAYLPGEYSFYGRKRYYTGYTAEPTIVIGYPEMCFNIAEAINRGWVTGNAEDWYKKGIQAAQTFMGVKEGANDVFFIKPGASPTGADAYNKHTVNFSFNTYYAQPAVQYAGNNANGLNQVLTQKYLAFFQNSGWEAYFNYRRTGVPAFAQGGAGTGNSGQIPKRFQYPVSEQSTNSAHLSAALQRQFGGADNINAEMWVIKN